MSTITNTQGLNTDLYWQEEKVKVSDGSEQNLSQESGKLRIGKGGTPAEKMLSLNGT